MNSVNSRPPLLLEGSSHGVEHHFGCAGVASAAGLQKGWMVPVLSFATIGYVVASQGLSFLPGWSLLGFAFALLLLMLLVAGGFLGLVQLKPAAWMWIALLFVAYSVLRAVPEGGQPWPADTLARLISVFIGGIGVALALQAGVPFKALAWAQVVIFLSNVAAGLLGFGMEGLAEGDGGRQSGLTGNANELAMQLTLGACLIWLFPRAAGLVPAALSGAAVAYAVVSTGSRKSLVVTAFFVSLLLLHLATRLKKSGGRVVLLLAGPLAALVLVLAPAISEHAQEVNTIQRTLDYQDSSFTLRVDMAQQAIRLWQDAPVIGWGTDAFRRLSGFDTYAHNNFLELLCNVGVVGCVLFYAIHVYILARSLWLPMPLKLACALLAVALIIIDAGAVSYTRKQTVMLLMILGSIAANPGILIPEQGSSWGGLAAKRPGKGVSSRKGNAAFKWEPLRNFRKTR